MLNIANYRAVDFSQTLLPFVWPFNSAPMFFLWLLALCFFVARIAAVEVDLGSSSL